MFYILFSLLLAQDIKVMVVDTGISSQVPEIAKYLAKQDKKELIDIHGHGTHITGIILYGPKLNTPLCSKIKIYSCRFFYPKSEITTTDCFKKAIELNMDYVNFSGGGYDFQFSEYYQVYKLTQKSKVIVAAGNENYNMMTNPFYPASYNMKNMDIVGSGRNETLKNKYSNFGLNGMLWRNGYKIKSFGIKEKYVILSGTSQATAVRTHELLQEECKK
jgi:thermitase